MGKIYIEPPLGFISCWSRVPRYQMATKYYTPLPIPSIPSSSDFHFLMMRSFKIVYGHIILKEGLKDILWPRCIELPLGFFLIGKGVQDILCIHVYMVVKYWTFYTIWFSFLLEKVFGILYNHKTILFDLKWGSPLKFLILR